MIFQSVDKSMKQSINQARNLETFRMSAYLLCFFSEGERSMSVISLSKVVPLRKQLGFLNMFSQLIEVLGTQASQYLPQLLEILFYCLQICKDALEQRGKVRDIRIYFVGHFVGGYLLLITGKNFENP